MTQCATDISAVTGYATLARDYEWLIPDALRSGEDTLERLAALLGPLPPTTRILDCACGSGIDALALAHHGHRVWGADASADLIKIARQRVEEAQLRVPFTVCTWEQLPDHFTEPFDLVLCIGNSLSHCLTEVALMRALAAMRAVLGPQGVLVVDSRNWEKLWRERPRLSTVEEPVVRNGIRCLALYLWDAYEQPEAVHHVEIVLLFDEGGRIEARRHELAYRPFRQEEFIAGLRAAGFTQIETDYRDEADRYALRARL